MVRTSLVWGPLLAVLVVTSAAAAQSGAHDMEARALFEAGRVAFIDERFEDALGHFRRAHELSRRPELLFNIAAALDRLDREAEALETFRQYLVALPEAPNREEVELRLRVLEAHVLRDAASSDAASAETAATAGATATETTPGVAGTTATSGEIAEIEAELGEETPIEVTGLGGEAGAGEGAATRDRAGGGSVAEEAWFWAVIGVVVVGAAAGITAGVLLSQDPGYGPYSGEGVAVMTLGGSF